MMKNFVKICFVLILTLLFIPQAFSQLQLTIYRDGIVHAKISIEIDENLPYVRIPLIGMNLSNVIAYNEKRELLNYEIENNEIEIFSLGSKVVNLEYDTGDLTFKLRTLWTLKLGSPFETSIIFPENTTIMGINIIPKQISIENNRVIIILNPGYYEIDYIIPITTEISREIFQLFWIFPIIIISIIVVFMAIALIIIKKRRNRKEGGEEEKVLNFIKRSGGRALEAEIRAAFPEIPRTTLWRMLKRLEKKGVIKIKKVGLQNLVELT